MSRVETSADRLLSFNCQGHALQAVLTLPTASDSAALSSAVVVIVGGPQYRVGSHRQFVQLARHLASRGHAVLRFDYRGMGDSEGAQRNFEHVSDDVGAAIDALAAQLPQLRQISLWGLCDGASAALLYLNDRIDRRVAGVCLVNPWVRSSASQARTQVKHYYTQRLRQREFWVKLLSGRVARGALADLWHSLHTLWSAPASSSSAAGSGSRPLPLSLPIYQARMAQGWKRFNGQILLLLSAGDFTAREFAEALVSDPLWAGAAQHRSLTRHDIAGADHTFSETAARQTSEAHCAEWLTTLGGLPNGVRA